MCCAAAWAQPCVAPGSCWPCPLSLACAFQVLKCLDLMKYGHNVLKILSRYLQGKSSERRHLALRGLVMLSKNPSMVRRGQRLELHLGKQPLGLAGLQELRQMLPVLLPHLPELLGTSLWPLDLVAAGWGCRARAVSVLQPFMASQHSLALPTGPKNVPSVSNPPEAAG